MRPNLVAIGALVILASACAATPATPETSAGAPSRVDLDAATAAAIAADDAMRSALATGDASALPSHFAGDALALLDRQVATARVRGPQPTEQVTGRRPVHASASARGAEVVLRISGTVDAGGRRTAFLRQWRAALEVRTGAWHVVEAGDLPPPQWWPEPQA